MKGTPTHKAARQNSPETTPPQASATTSPEALLPEQRKVLHLAGACTCSMVLGVSSIMPLLPMLAGHFQVSIPLASLLIIAFTLPGIFFTPLAGVLADKYGRKTVLLPSFLLFSVAGGACALAPNFTVLVCLRFFQGIGAASFGMLNATILGDTFTGSRLSRYMGWNMALLSICTALFPALGGALGQLDWRLPFALPVLALPGVWVTLRAPLRGAGPAKPLMAYLAGMFRAGAAPSTRRLLLMTFLTFIILYGPIITCFPVLAHERFAAPPALIGALLTLSSLGTGLASWRFGTLTTRFSLVRLLLASQVCYLVALFAIPVMPTMLALLPALMLYGIGQGLNIPSIQSALMACAPPEGRASIMALNGTLLRLGQTISPFIFSTLADGVHLSAPFLVATSIPLAMLLLTRSMSRE